MNLSKTPPWLLFFVSCCCWFLHFSSSFSFFFVLNEGDQCWLIVFDGNRPFGVQESDFGVFFVCV